MIDIKRRVPRFDIKFELLSNLLNGKGINISQTGIGFLTEEEIIPADNIPFETEIKGYIFSDKIYKIKGTGNLLYSKKLIGQNELYRNGLKFVNMDDDSKEALFNLLNDIRLFKSDIKDENTIMTLADFYYYPSDDLFAKTSIFSEYIDKNFLINHKMFSYYLDSSCSAVGNMINRKTKDKKEMIMLGSNNYLGLATHPEVIKAGIEALKKYGAGNGAGAMVGGTLGIHKQLEEELADFIGKEEAMIFNSGYSANIGILSGILRPNDVVINDQYNHASIFDGCRLSQSKLLVFKHNDINSLEKIVKRAKYYFNGCIIVIDGIYSTDGSLSPLDEIYRIARTYDCKIMVDEAHALGILGKKGRGTTEYFNLTDKIDIIMGTLSKSLGSSGGFVASSKNVIEYLRFYARSYLFSTSFPPSVAATVLKALHLIKTDNSIREKLHFNISYFINGLKKLNLDIGEPKSAVVPIFISDQKLLFKISSLLFDNGLFHNVMIYPAVPMGGSLLRFGITTSLDENILKKALVIIEKVLKEVGFLK
ncbi:MAG: aminotransferase class I/II-fold pyridoxal phosphate-dependent enzyme [Spirochaetes bacterium]|nr:aminotransferase class I/II-fold pyridoxal phosphate-dependent enzyme [Spirochaetota bacterium]